MLGKLLKYDTKRIFKVMIVFYILTLLFALISRILVLSSDKFIIVILSKIASGVMFAMIANNIIVAILRCWALFREKIYKDESYLTHTLPISKNCIFNSKVITSFLVLISSFVISILGILICYYNTDLFNSLLNILKSSYNITSNDSIIFITLIIIILFLELFTVIITGIGGIVLGHRKNNNKNLFSFIYGFIIYTLSQIFLLIITYFISIFNQNLHDIFRSTSITYDTMYLLLNITIVIYIIITLVIYIISLKILNKGVNID